jgi:eukaryotic-like serine/threonine-protein kinase
MAVPSQSQGKAIGRYVLYDEIAAGGMATVHLGRLMGAAGFSRTVAIKRLHEGLVRDPEFASMFMDEARLAARIRHPNVVSVLDVVHEAGELFLVMDYVQGESLSRLVRAVRPGVMPPRITTTIIAGVLHGLHAAHEATTEHGEPLHIVHRDVSPQNVMVGTDGVGRVLDFGVAKAAHRAQTTKDGTVKGKISYMAPEQLLSEHVDRRADVYACAVVLWEALTGERLFDGDNQGRIVRKILDETVPVPSSKVAGLRPTLDAAVMKGLEKDPRDRWQTAREFAAALERAMPTAPLTDIGEFVESIAGQSLTERARRLKEIESRSEILPAVRPPNPTIPAPRSVPPQSASANSPTVPQAFAVVKDPTSGLVPKSPRIPTPIDVPSDPPPNSAPMGPPTPPSQPRLQIPSPFAPMPVQTLAIAPSAKLDPVAAPRVEDLLKARTPPKPFVAQPLPPLTVEKAEAGESTTPAKRRGRAGSFFLFLGVLLALGAGGAVVWFLLKHLVRH